LVQKNIKRIPLNFFSHLGTDYFSQCVSTPRQGVRGAVHGNRVLLVPYLGSRADFSQLLRARPTLVLSMFVCGSYCLDFRLKTLTSAAGCRNSSNPRWNQPTDRTMHAISMISSGKSDTHPSNIRSKCGSNRVTPYKFRFFGARLISGWWYLLCCHTEGAECDS